jgi:hypothetical protein
MVIQIQTALGPGTNISFDRPFTIQWKGGTAGTLVKVTLTSVNGPVSTSDYAYADASSGSITFDPLCISGVCSLFLAIFNNVQVAVEVSPPPASAAVLTAQGVTGTVTATWTYRYVFSGPRLGM